MSQQVKDTESVVDMMTAKPEHQHRWLERLVGDWTFETDAPAQEGQPSSKSIGTESVRSIGGLWIQAEGHGEMPGGGGPATTVMTLGYDTQKKRFVGSWIGSMMTYMWVYDGELDAGERVLTLSSEGPSMSGDGTMSSYQDLIEFKGNDHRTLTGRVRTPDGAWQQFMTVDYRRKK
jgi:Protein of unknown function (DUF1579)